MKKVAVQWSAVLLLVAVASLTTKMRFGGRAAAATPATELRRVTVEVVNSEGTPVAGAEVEALAGYRPVATGKTDAQGRSELSVHSEEPVQWIIALKSGVGLDYAESGGSEGMFLPRPARELPDVVKLKLDGARTVRIHAEGERQLDLAGVRFVPWVLSKRGKRSYVNLSGSRIASATSDGGGVATFDWLPAKAASAPREEVGVTFLAASENYDWADPPDTVPYSVDGVELKARIQLKGTISGKATLPNGTPAAGIKLLAEGRGNTLHVCCQTAVTGSDGSYVMKVSPGQIYMVAVVDEKWTAATRAAIEIRAGEVRNDVDFALEKGFLISGTAAGPEGKNPVGNLVFVRYKGPELPRSYWGPVPELFPNAALIRQTVTASGGRYGLRVPAGEYEIGIGAGAAGYDGTHYHVTSIKVQDHDVILDIGCKRSTNPARTTASLVKANHGEPYDFATLRVRILSGNNGCLSCHRPHM
jgi:hypothetical protein